MFLTGVWHLDLDLDMVTGLWTPMIQILAPYFDFESARNIHVLHVLIWGLEVVGVS